jgi:hypothetical protein
VTESAKLMTNVVGSMSLTHIVHTQNQVRQTQINVMYL